jgi:spore coat polysaccharide biosynthesis protein SpsF
VSPRVVAGVQARSSSSRLPGKVLADLAGKPLIERVVERARRAVMVDEVVVLTSTDPSDDALCDVLAARGIPFRRGPLDDVLARYVALVQELAPALVVRITGDAPLLEPDFVDLQLGALTAFEADLVRVEGNQDGRCAGTLGGQGVMSSRALLRARLSSDRRDREHVGSFFLRSHAHEFRHVEIEVDPGYHRPGLRLCVDEPADLELVRRVYEHFGDTPFTTLEALRWLDGHPEVAALNAGVEESADNQACRRLDRRAETEVVGKWLWRTS